MGALAVVVTTRVQLRRSYAISATMSAYMFATTLFWYRELKLETLKKWTAARTLFGFKNNN